MVVFTPKLFWNEYGTENFFDQSVGLFNRKNANQISKIHEILGENPKN